jgi:hypothetical protein
MKNVAASGVADLRAMLAKLTVGAAVVMTIGRQLGEICGEALVARQGFVRKFRIIRT